jgi:hypothetical protein
MSYSFDECSGFVHTPVKEISIQEELSNLEYRESYLLACLQSNVSDSFKDGLQYKLDVLRAKKNSLKEDL